jgi:hypothetical protein
MKEIIAHGSLSLPTKQSKLSYLTPSFLILKRHTGAGLMRSPQRELGSTEHVTCPYSCFSAGSFRSSEESSSISRRKLSFTVSHSAIVRLTFSLSLSLSYPYILRRIRSIEMLKTGVPLTVVHDQLGYALFTTTLYLRMSQE